MKVDKTIKININIEDCSIEAKLKERVTAKKILDDLPFESTANIWGDEIYFNIPTKIELADDARAKVEIGELGYWPVGPAFCIFFGKTPASKADEIRPASPVNVFGKLSAVDLENLRRIPDGENVTVEKAG